MSTVVDLAGNNPVALDPAITRHDKVSSVEFRGASQSLVVDSSAVTSTVFGNLTRFIRIAVDGQSMFYDIDVPGTADATSAAKRMFLADGAVEAVPVRPGQVIQVIEHTSTGAGVVTITEDK